MPRNGTRRRVPAAALLLLASLLGCGGSTDARRGGGFGGSIRIDGSSTVAPLSEAAAEIFREDHPDVQITVGTSGTGGGFKRLCNGEVDIADASRRIKEEEVAACAANGVRYDELQVANDGIAIVVNRRNDWVKCLTVEQLHKIWDRASRVRSWRDVDPDFPDVDIKLFGAGTESGTFDFFTGAVNGEEGRSRTDYNATEDDNVTVQGVSGSKGALGYFGLSYLEQNERRVRSIKVDGGEGCVAPSQETVQDGTYQPLSRPLFIYPSAEVVRRQEGKEFLEFYVDATVDIAEQALFVPLTEEQQAVVMQKLRRLTGRPSTPAS